MMLSSYKSLPRAFEWMRRKLELALSLIPLLLSLMGNAQVPTTTTVQGTVYLANGQPGSGTLVLSWPAFTTAAGQAIAADSTTVTIPTDGFVSVNLAPNLGATPAGLYYTAVYYLSDGSSSRQYWVVPAASSASLAQVQSQVMPAAQAVQAVSKAYVDQAISEATLSGLTAAGGTLTGPLYLNADPTQPLQAADKHYVDITAGTSQSNSQGTINQTDLFPGADFGTKLQACLSALSASYGGTCDARNFTATQSMASNLTISTSNVTILLPCATISTANQLIVTAGTRNVSLRGCALRGASAASGSQGGTVFLYSGSAAAIKVGDPTYAANTSGFHLDNVVINTTASSSATAQAFVAYRAQELDLESLYLLGNQNQTGITLDGTGNYTGGTFYDDQIDGFQTAVNSIGHQVSNPATTDWMNASTFVRLHIDCPETSGSPISGTYGINLQQGDGNTFTGGDVEGCSTALHLGANAQNNTVVGLRNEVSTNQVVADSGSSYNSWITGGTMFTGALTDNGTRNSFLDTFHRSFNGLSGDWYGSQQDATVTNHYRIGIGTGNERGLLNRYQTDYGYRWTTGLSDATAGEQFYQILDELNGIYRLSIGQYNNGSSSTNNQTVLNSAGSGAIVLNGSTNAGVGGVVFGSGGSTETTVATIGNTGNALFNGTLQVGSTSTFVGSTMVKNQLDAEIDQFLQAGLTTSQKESLTYKDWNGNSQWYMVKDQNNNWALNSATGGLDSFKAYQSTNSGDTYIDTSNSTGVVRVNYETGSGTAFNIYGGSSSSLYASFTGATSIKFPGLAAGSGHNCLQVDNSGFLSNTGSACGSGGTPPAVTYNVLSYGAVADRQDLIQGNVSTSGNVLNAASGTFTSASVGKYVVLDDWTAQPFATTPSVSQIASYVNSSQVVLSQTVANNTTVYFSMGTDNTPAFIACQNAVLASGAAYGKVGQGTCTAPAGNYLLATSPYYIEIGASDDGSYGTPAGGSGAVLAATVSSSAPYGLSGVTVSSGGSGYTPNSTLQTTISGGCGLQGYSNGACGYAWGTASTNSSGQVSTATVVYAGYNFQSAPTVTVKPLGGDGAAATVTVSGGTIQTPTIISGGGGYPPSVTNIPVFALGGSGCVPITGYQNVPGVSVTGIGSATTNASGAVVSSTITTNTTGCTAAPTIVFGSLPCWDSADSLFDQQCTNIAPLNPIAMPVSIPLAPNVSWQGTEGRAANLAGNWDGLSYDNKESILFGSGAISYTSISGFTLGASYMSIASQFSICCNATINNDTFSNPAIGIYNGATDLGAQMFNLWFYAEAPVVNGGQWNSRADSAQLNGGFFNSQREDNFVTFSTYSSKLDDWFAVNFWGTPYSAKNTDFYETCAFPQSANQRMTGPEFSVYQFLGQANTMCYPGVSGSAVLEIGRGGNGDYGHNLGNITAKSLARYLYYGGFGNGTFNNSSGSEGVTVLSSDPYRSASVQHAGIVTTGTTGLISNVGFGGASGSTGQCWWELQNSSASPAGLPMGQQQGLQCTGTTAQPAIENYDNYLSHAANVTLFDNHPSGIGIGAQGTAAAGGGQLTPYPYGMQLMGPGGTGSIVDLFTAGFSPVTFHYGVSVPRLADTGAAASSGTACLQVDSGGNVTNTGSACGGSSGSVTSFAAPSASWPAWLVPTVTNSTSTPSLAVAASATGTGNVVLASGPTFTGNTTTFANAAAAEQDVAIQPGTGADQIGAFAWNNYSGTAQWKFRKDASNYLRLTDVVNSLDREVFFQSGQTILNSGAGANATVVNGSTGSGTGGLLVESGGSSPAAVLTVTGGGNTTATGFIAGKFLIGSGTMTLTAGAASGTGPTIACVSSHVCDGVSGTVTLTTGVGPTTGTLATLGFPNTHTNQANCVVSPTLSGTGLVTSITWSESTTALTLTANTALTASTAYQIRYWCGGN